MTPLATAFKGEGRERGNGEFANPRMLIAKKRYKVVLAAQSGKRSCCCRRACKFVPTGDGRDGMFERPLLFSCRCELRASFREEAEYTGHGCCLVLHSCLPGRPCSAESFASQSQADHVELENRRELYCSCNPKEFA